MVVDLFRRICQSIEHTSIITKYTTKSIPRLPRFVISTFFGYNKNRFSHYFLVLSRYILDRLSKLDGKRQLHLHCNAYDIRNHVRFEHE